MTEQEHQLLQIIWNYLKLDQPLKKADIMLVFGSLQTQPAVRAAELYHQGFAPLMIMTGGFGIISKDHNDQPEAEIYAEIAHKLGVPKDAILTEPKATNTSENIAFTKELLHTHHLHPKNILLVHKIYDERRTLATFQKQWPNIPATITSPQMSLDEWLAQPLQARDHVSVLVGIVQRIMLYPSYGYMVEQTVPDSVQNAFDELVNHGFTAGLIDRPKSLV
jgi:uncharacterized SAM-binding protein YcdF (DUF218 family)